jgi:GTPase SAR1 family protein
MPGIKLIVMGVGGVGKSALTNRFVIGRWVEKVRKLISNNQISC